MVPFVRIPGCSPELVPHALNAGAGGVVMPHIQNAKQAEQLVRLAHFPPMGDRSFPPAALINEQQNRTPEGQTTYDVWNNHAAVICQIEDLQGLENIEEICRVPGSASSIPPFFSQKEEKILFVWMYICCNASANPSYLQLTVFSSVLVICACAWTWLQGVSMVMNQFFVLPSRRSEMRQKPIIFPSWDLASLLLPFSGGLRWAGMHSSSMATLMPFAHQPFSP